NVVCSGIVNINEESDDQKLHVYPNPSSGDFTLVLPFEPKGNLHMKIQDIAGKCVYQAGILNQRQTLHTVIPPGIYFLSVMDDISGQRDVFRIVIR
ncbi:MAG: T9SS type A sorting domain-containing protein, partial [Bacteroidales bacterium]|nr:T9SS type A sorting domain-containing protein [Bacteroidales bacterium]